MGTELTAVPHRIFNAGFAHCLDDDLVGNGLLKAQHSATFVPNCYLGYDMDGAWSHWWWGLARPTDADWGLVSGADEVIDFWWTTLCSLIANTTANSHFHLRVKTTDHTNAENVDMAVATGQVYKAGGDWTTYPAFGHVGSGADVVQVNLADLPKSYILYGETYVAGPTDWTNQDHFIRAGWNGRMMNLNVGDPGAGQVIEVELVFSEVLVRYHNPCVNALSRLLFDTAGGQDLILTGLGFDLLDANVENLVLNPNNQHPLGGWDSWVDHIQIIDAATSAVIATLHEHTGDFIRDSNTQITIPVMPALVQGTYWLKLIKDGAQLNGILTAGTNPAGYAGDWRTDAAGLMTAGSRFVLIVGYTPGDIIVVTDWEAFDAHYAPIDTCAPTVFYDGRILSLSSYTRGVSSGSGLYLGCDMNIGLANTDREFSHLLFDNLVKNTYVSAYYVWQNMPAAAKVMAIKLLVDDYDLQGPVFMAKLRDISVAHFSKQVPIYRCTIEEFPNIHENAVNKTKPEILGKYEFTSGAIEAVYVDTTTFVYLAAHGHLHAITAVYSDGIVVAPADYVVSYDADDQTLITFTADQGDKRITFDCEGYERALWNSVNGYVQNPAYIVGYFLLYLALVPAVYLDTDSVDDLALKYVALAVETAGKLAVIKEASTEEYFQSLLFTYGALAAYDSEGRWWLDRKDLSDFATDHIIWAQIDTQDHPVRNFNTLGAFNRMRARWDWAPAAEVFQGGEIFEHAASIVDLRDILEPSFESDFPWIDDAAWIEARATEELLKYSYGYNSFVFTVSLSWIDKLELLDNLRLQDPYGVSETGIGEAGHLLYVDQLEVDFGSRTIRVTCRDLSYLLGQYFVLGDEAILPANWSGTATAEQRIYGYLCNETTGRFADGTPGKMLCDEAAM